MLATSTTTARWRCTGRSRYRQGRHGLTDGRVQRERRVRDGEGCGGERLDRRATRGARGADGHPPRRRRPHPHVPRERRRRLDGSTVTIRIRRDEEIWKEE